MLVLKSLFRIVRSQAIDLFSWNHVYWCYHKGWAANLRIWMEEDKSGSVSNRPYINPNMTLLLHEHHSFTDLLWLLIHEFSHSFYLSSIFLTNFYRYYNRQFCIYWLRKIRIPVASLNLTIICNNFLSNFSEHIVHLEPWEWTVDRPWTVCELWRITVLWTEPFVRASDACV